MGSEILLYVPNIIGYVRVILTAAAFMFYNNPPVFLPLYVTSVILDGVDGYAARKLNQCSAFGAWLDVVVDLLGRGLLWCRLYQYGYLAAFVEWLTFVSTHCRGPQWKTTEDSFPWLVQQVMANGFKTPWGIVAITGIHILPIWLYGWESGALTSLTLLPVWFQLMGIALLTIGRVICLFVELFFVFTHVQNLLNHDPSRTAN